MESRESGLGGLWVGSVVKESFGWVETVGIVECCFPSKSRFGKSNFEISLSISINVSANTSFALWGSWNVGDFKLSCIVDSDLKGNKSALTSPMIYS